MKNDTTKIVTDNDTLTYLCTELQEIDNQYKDFRFITETSGEWSGPQHRDVSYVSAGWNFTILFIVMIMVVLNKFLAPGRFASIIIMPFQSGGEKMIRESSSFLNIISLSIVVSFVLMLSMFIQKIFVIYGDNDILHDNISFFFDIALVVTTVFIFNYLITSFYSWLFKNDALLSFHVNLHVSAMASLNLLLIPIMMVLFFYPYKFLCVSIIVILSIFFIIRLVKLLIEVRMLSKLSFVNIFLYLCTVEILPVLIIFKMILKAI